MKYELKVIDSEAIRTLLFDNQEEAFSAAVESVKAGKTVKLYHLIRSDLSDMVMIMAANV